MIVHPPLTRCLNFKTVLYGPPDHFLNKLHIHQTRVKYSCIVYSILNIELPMLTIELPVLTIELPTLIIELPMLTI